MRPLHMMEDNLEPQALLGFQSVDCRHSPMRLVYAVLGIEPLASCMLGKHSTG